MSNPNLAPVFVNPLEFLEAGFYHAGIFPQKPTLEDAMKFLCGPDLPHDIDSLLKRYRDIDAAQTQRLNIAPLDPQFMAKIVRPLAQAKGAYMIGNFLGTISLCGMVCEMLSLLLFEILPLQINGRPMSGADQERVFGDSLDQLRQERRVRILFAFGMITEDIKSYFDCVRKLRNKYLHVYVHEAGDPSGDAREAHAQTVSLVVKTLGYSIRHGAVQFRPEFMKYLVHRPIERGRKTVDGATCGLPMNLASGKHGGCHARTKDGVDCTDERCPT